MKTKIVLCTILSAFALSACGGSSSSDNASTDSPDTSMSQPAGMDAVTAAMNLTTASSDAGSEATDGKVKPETCAALVKAADDLTAALSGKTESYATSLLATADKYKALGTTCQANQLNAGLMDLDSTLITAIAAIP